jgi:predicted TIM-barrel fold metal-dependent hydrolase
MTRSATCENPESRFYAGFIGDGVLMYASDYPHSECQFPESVDNILAWKSIKPETQKKLLGGTADRFFKQV